MAEGIRYNCSSCSKTIEAWSDGNPYFIDDRGQKQYAYHPDHEGLSRCVGNDSPCLCLGCGEEFLVDSRDPARNCPACGSAEFVPTFKLEGSPCPFCKEGVFRQDENFHAIS